MAKHVSGKRARMWQVSSVWVKRRDGPERVLLRLRADGAAQRDHGQRRDRDQKDRDPSWLHVRPPP